MGSVWCGCVSLYFSPLPGARWRICGKQLLTGFLDEGVGTAGAIPELEMAGVGPSIRGADVDGVGNVFAPVLAVGGCRQRRGRFPPG